MRDGSAKVLAVGDLGGRAGYCALYPRGVQDRVLWPRAADLVLGKGDRYGPKGGVSRRSSVLVQFLGLGFYLPALAAAGGSWCMRDSARVERRLILISTTLYLLWVLSLGAEPMMGYFYRFYVPALPFVFLLAQETLWSLLDSWRSCGVGARLPAALAIVAIAAVAGNGYWVFSKGIAGRYPHTRNILHYNLGQEATYGRMAAWLKQRVPASTRVAMLDAGLFAYRSDLEVFDLGGLASRQMAELYWAVRHNPPRRSHGGDGSQESRQRIHHAVASAGLYDCHTGSREGCNVGRTRPAAGIEGVQHLVRVHLPRPDAVLRAARRRLPHGQNAAHIHEETGCTCRVLECATERRERWRFCRQRATLTPAAEG